MMRTKLRSCQFLTSFFFNSELSDTTAVQYAYYLLHLNNHKDVESWDYLKDFDSICGIINKKKSIHTRRGYLTAIIYVLDCIDLDDEYYEAKGKYISKFYGEGSYRYYTWKSER